jgi:hypothetical protein
LPKAKKSFTIAFGEEASTLKSTALPSRRASSSTLFAIAPRHSLVLGFGQRTPRSILGFGQARFQPVAAEAEKRRESVSY